MNFVDPYINLPDIVDIGGDKYFLGEQKPINLGFKSRKDFLNAYGSHSEYLIRKYLYFNADYKKTQFDTDKEKQMLLNILEKRIKDIESSADFSSNELAKTINKRVVINIRKIIEVFKGPDYKPGDGFDLKISLPWGKDKKYVESLSEEQIFNLILEISWYLLHPNDVPKKVQGKWYSLIKKLDTTRVINIIDQINKEAEVKGLTQEKPYNYFKKIDLEKSIKMDTLNDAVSEIKKMALDTQDDILRTRLQKRLESILLLLQAKKYISEDIRKSAINPSTNVEINVEDISGSLIINPMIGGSINNTLGETMLPFFDYYKDLYDPIYTFLSDSISKIDNINIPSLIKLFHIINNLETPDRKYGVYRISGASNAKNVISSLINATNVRLDGFTSDDDKDLFLEQVEKLPKISLSETVTSDAFLRFFTIPANMTIPTKDVFTDPMKGFPKKTASSHLVSSSNTDVSSLNFDDVFADVQQFFTDDNFIIYSEDSDKIPMNLYDIQINDIDIKNNTIPVTLSENKINSIKIKGRPFYLEDLLTIRVDSAINASEIILTTLIAFKNLMPK